MKLKSYGYKIMCDATHSETLQKYMVINSGCNLRAVKFDSSFTLKDEFIGYFDLYKHFKGGLYYLLSNNVELEYDDKTTERHVLYRSFDTNKIWLRPFDMFFDTNRFTQQNNNDKDNTIYYE
ncbi:MAG: DUF1653 domain-containing protein [Syntrophothermus sp.]